MSESNEFMGSAPEQNQPDPAVGESKPSGNDLSALLAAITNPEGKPKYDSVEKALVALSHSQEHIARLEAEAQQRKELETKVATMEQLLARLGEGKQVDQPVVQKPEEQEALVLSVLEKREAQKRQEDNRKAVIETLAKRFGEKTDEVLRQKAQELGISVSQLGAQAALSPKAVLAWFPEARSTTPLSGSVNTQGFHSESKPIEPLPIGASNKEVKAYLRTLRAEVEKEMGLA